MANRLECVTIEPIELDVREALLLLVRLDSADGDELALFLREPFALGYTPTVAAKSWPHGYWPAPKSARAQKALERAKEKLVAGAKSGALRGFARDDRGALTTLSSAHFASYTLDERDDCLRLPDSGTPIFTGLLFNAEDVRRLAKSLAPAADILGRTEDVGRLTGKGSTPQQANNESQAKKRASVLLAASTLLPNGIPRTLQPKVRDARINRWLDDNDYPTVDPVTIRRALKWAVRTNADKSDLS
jgi:hypothetical protein